MKLGINFLLDPRFLIDSSTFSFVPARTSSYESKKVSGRFPDDLLFPPGLIVAWSYFEASAVEIKLGVQTAEIRCPYYLRDKIGFSTLCEGAFHTLYMWFRVCQIRCAL